MKRKTVQTKYDVPVRRAFRWASEQQSCSAEASMIVRIPAPWLTKEIIFVYTVFLSFTLWMTCERTLIFAQSTLWIAPQNLQFTLWNSRLWNFHNRDHSYNVSVGRSKTWYMVTDIISKFSAGSAGDSILMNNCNAGSILSQRNQCRSMCWSKIKNT